MPMPEKTILSAGIIIVREQDNNWNYLFLRAFAIGTSPRVKSSPEKPLLKQRSVKPGKGRGSRNFFSAGAKGSRKPSRTTAG